MPTYDYQCRSCGLTTEVIHSMLEDGPAVCEACGGDLRRVLFPAGIIFKGSGFYRNDARSNGSPGPDASKQAGSSASSPPSEKGSDKGRDKGSEKGKGDSGSTPAPSTD